MSEELTNNGKPHICGEIAVHNTPLNVEGHLCNNCNLPVDAILSTPQMSDEWEEEFDVLFTQEALDDEPIYVIPKRIKSFIRKTLAQQLERIEERVEDCRKEKSRCGCADDDGSCYQQCSASYNEAVDDVLQILDKEINK